MSLIGNAMSIRVGKQLWEEEFHVLVCQYDYAENRISAIAKPLTLTKREPEQLIMQPTVYLDQREAQRLIDELWSCGLRPSEGSGSAGALAATQRHLEDMRKLVFEVKR